MKTQTSENDLSDFHKLTFTFLKMHFKEAKQILLMKDCG